MVIGEAVNDHCLVMINVLKVQCKKYYQMALYPFFVRKCLVSVNNCFWLLIFTWNLLDPVYSWSPKLIGIWIVSWCLGHIHLHLVIKSVPSFSDWNMISVWIIVLQLLLVVLEGVLVWLFSKDSCVYTAIKYTICRSSNALLLCLLFHFIRLGLLQI